MQAIAGTHFNSSLPPAFWPEYREHLQSSLDARAFQSGSLMGLVRNYRRCGWLLTYLYGASPAFCKSFRPQGHQRLESLNSSTWYAPYSTSLRVSDMGYRNSTQARLNVPVNSLDEYLAGLAMALTTGDPRYAAMGVLVDGDYRQLNANVLQLENEYYSSIRPKPASKSPRLIAALRSSGVAYVEVRTLDLNPFAPIGVSLEQTRFVEALLLYCLLGASPPITTAEQAEIDQRELAVAWEGRKPGLQLPHQGGTLPLRDAALEILDALAAIAPLLDAGTGVYGRVIDTARDAVLDPEETLSARVLDALGGGRRSFFDWAFELAGSQRELFLRHEFAPGRFEELRAVAAESLAVAAAREAAPEPPFARYLADLLASGVGDGEPVS
jgi:glutamate--cysteine ligase